MSEDNEILLESFNLKSGKSYDFEVSAKADWPSWPNMKFQAVFTTDSDKTYAFRVATGLGYGVNTRHIFLMLQKNINFAKTLIIEPGEFKKVMLTFLKIYDAWKETQDGKKASGIIISFQNGIQKYIPLFVKGANIALRSQKKKQLKLIGVDEKGKGGTIDLFFENPLSVFPYFKGKKFDIEYLTNNKTYQELIGKNTHDINKPYQLKQTDAVNSSEPAKNNVVYPSNVPDFAKQWNPNDIKTSKQAYDIGFKIGLKAYENGIDFGDYLFKDTAFLFFQKQLDVFLKQDLVKGWKDGWTEGKKSAVSNQQNSNINWDEVKKKFFLMGSQAFADGITSPLKDKAFVNYLKALPEIPSDIKPSAIWNAGNLAAMMAKKQINKMIENAKEKALQLGVNAYITDDVIIPEDDKEFVKLYKDIYGNTDNMYNSELYNSWNEGYKIGSTGKLTHNQKIQLIKNGIKEAYKLGKLAIQSGKSSDFKKNNYMNFLISKFNDNKIALDGLIDSWMKGYNFDYDENTNTAKLVSVSDYLDYAYQLGKEAVSKGITSPKADKKLGDIKSKFPIGNFDELNDAWIKGNDSAQNYSFSSETTLLDNQLKIAYDRGFVAPEKNYIGASDDIEFQNMIKKYSDEVKEKLIDKWNEGFDAKYSTISANAKKETEISYVKMLQGSGSSKLTVNQFATIVTDFNDFSNQDADDFDIKSKNLIGNNVIIVQPIKTPDYYVALEKSKVDIQYKILNSDQYAEEIQLKQSEYNKTLKPASRPDAPMVIINKYEDIIKEGVGKIEIGPVSIDLDATSVFDLTTKIKNLSDFFNITDKDTIYKISKESIYKLNEKGYQIANRIHTALLKNDNILSKNKKSNSDDFELSSVRSYTGSTYSGINDVLRGRSDSKSYDNYIKNIDNVFSKDGIRLPQNVRVYRGQSIDKNSIDGLREGKTYELTAYSSCSFSPQVAQGFTKSLDANNYAQAVAAIRNDEMIKEYIGSSTGNKILFDISRLDRCLSLYLEGITSITNEYELLLNRGVILKAKNSASIIKIFNNKDDETKGMFFAKTEVFSDGNEIFESMPKSFKEVYCRLMEVTEKFDNSIDNLAIMNFYLQNNLLDMISNS